MTRRPRRHAGLHPASSLIWNSTENEIVVLFRPWFILESFFSTLFINVMNSVAGGQEDYEIQYNG